MYKLIEQEEKFNELNPWERGKISNDDQYNPSIFTNNRRKR